METQDILKALQLNDGTLPRAALEAAIASRDQIIPELLSILEHAEKNADNLLDQESYMAHIYAMYLLAQFRETRAYPLLVKFFSLPGDISLDLTGDVVTEDLDRILASVSDGDTSLLMSLAENEEANEYVRGAALKGLLTLVACSMKSREEVLAYYQSLFRGRLTRVPSHVWSELVCCCTEMYPEEVYEDIRQAYEEELPDCFMLRLEDVDEDLALGKEKVMKRLRESRYSTLIDDTIREMEWWAGFKQDRRPRHPKLSGNLPSNLFGSPKPFVAPPKVGPNDTCPCGSGKKYKKCCGFLGTR